MVPSGIPSEGTSKTSGERRFRASAVSDFPHGDHLLQAISHVEIFPAAVCVHSMPSICFCSGQNEGIACFSVTMLNRSGKVPSKAAWTISGESRVNLNIRAT